MTLAQRNPLMRLVNNKGGAVMAEEIASVAFNRMLVTDTFEYLPKTPPSHKCATRRIQDGVSSGDRPIHEDKVPGHKRTFSEDLSAKTLFIFRRTGSDAKRIKSPLAGKTSATPKSSFFCGLKSKQMSNLGTMSPDLEVVNSTTPDFISAGLKESPDSMVLKTTPDSVVIRVSPDSAIVKTSLHSLLDRSMRKGSDVTSQEERSFSGSSGLLQSQNHAGQDPRSKGSPQGSKYYPDCSYIAPTSCVYPSGVHISDVQTSGKLISGMHTSVSPPCFVYHNVPKFLGKIRTNPWIVNLDRHKTVAKTADGNARISNCINPNARLNCTNARLNARLPVTTTLQDTTNNCC